MQCPVCTPVRTELFQQQQETIRRQEQRQQAARAAAEAAAAEKAAAFNAPPQQKRCYYAELKVPPGCAGATLKKAYHSAAMKWHPDKNGGAPEATERFKAACEAYEVLSDARKRRAYDRCGHAGLAEGGDVLDDQARRMAHAAAVFRATFGPNPVMFAYEGENVDDVPPPSALPGIGGGFESAIGHANDDLFDGLGLVGVYAEYGPGQKAMVVLDKTQTDKFVLPSLRNF